MASAARIYVFEYVHKPPGARAPHGVIVRAAGLSSEDALDNAKERFGKYLAEKHPGGTWHFINGILPVCAELG